MEMKEIGQRMRSRREYLGLTQAEVASAMSVASATYSRYESGQLAVSAPDIPLAAKVLRTTPGYFYGEEEDRRPEEVQYEPILDELHSASYTGGLDDRDISEVAEIIRVKAKRHAERQGRG